jgi:hypothetical protein
VGGWKTFLRGFQFPFVEGLENSVPKGGDPVQGDALNGQPRLGPHRTALSININLHAVTRRKPEFSCGKGVR